MHATAAAGRFPFRHLTLAEVRELEHLEALLAARQLEHYGQRWGRYHSLRARKIKEPDRCQDAAS